jgi:putative alpha-1,2-mannosidase
MLPLLLCLLFVPVLVAAHRDPLAYFNPPIGTQKSRIGYGGTMPFVSPPFAMTNWTPQTRQNKISTTSYEYDDTAITGFIGTHQPAIWMGDYGYITLMPQVGELRTMPEARQLAFSHSDETANPDYYAVSLRIAEGTRIRVEMTATERCAYLRFRFPSRGVARVLVEISRPGVPGFAAADQKTREITGYNPHRMDEAAELQRPLRRSVPPGSTERRNLRP